MSVALYIKFVKRMRRIILSSIICPALLYFSTLSGTGIIFFWAGGGDILSTECVFLFSLQILPEIFLILRINQKDIIINLHRPSRKVEAS